MKNSKYKQGAAAAELALKAHVLRSSPEILAEIGEGHRLMQSIAEMVDLTEAPEDAICSMVIDLMHYCDREKIHWNSEVMPRAWEHFANERAHEVQKPPVSRRRAKSNSRC